MKGLSPFFDKNIGRNAIAFNNCPFCGDVVTMNIQEDGTYLVNCGTCGVFKIEEDIVDHPPNNINELETVAYVRKLHGWDRYFLHSDNARRKVSGAFGEISLKDFLAELPQGLEVFDKALYNLSLQCPHVYDSLNLYNSVQFDLYKHLFYCQSDDQARRVYNTMREMGYLTGELQDICISANGWARLQEIKRNLESGKAFVAMWFNARTDLYREAVKSAVDAAGYSPNEILVDETHHNDYIMDKVINMIDDSRFVIADFTCAPEEEADGNVRGGTRGGVYFEAGYARGKGKQVIHSCSADDDSSKRRHFDIDQINTIFWNEADGVLKASEHDFIDVLTQRIIATVGRGPLWHESKGSAL